MTPILRTKLFIPSIRPTLVPRRRLVEQLIGGLHCKLTLISAPASFGKTTLVAEWVNALRNTQEANGNLVCHRMRFTMRLRRRILRERQLWWSWHGPKWMADFSQ